MSIFKRSNSPNWYVKLKDPLTGEWVEKSTGTPVRRRALREAERIELEALKASEGVAEEGPLFSEAALAYLAEMERLGRHPQHVHSAKGALKAFERSLGPVVYLAPAVRIELLAAFLASLSGKAAGTRICTQSLLSAFLAYCVGRGWLASNPLKGVKKPRYSKVRPKRAFSREEWDRLANSLCKRGKESRLSIYSLALLSGLRREELRRVGPPDFNLEAKLWTLRPEVQKVKVPVTLPFLPGVADLLPRLAFPLTVPYHETLTEDLRLAGVEKVKGGRWLTFHSLRHTFITWLARGGMPVEEVRKYARHSTIKETVQTYMDLGLGDLLATSSALPDFGIVGSTRAEGLRESGPSLKGPLSPAGETGPGGETPKS